MGQTKILISKTGLQKLYWGDKLSTAEIARKFNCTHSAVVYKMQSLGIERRTKLGLRKPVYVKAQTLKKLYLQRKLSELKIAKLLGCSRGAIEKRMRLFGIKARIYSESNTRYPKKDFSGNLIEMAYLIGFRLGDLNVFKKDHLLIVKCSSSVVAQVDLIKNLFSEYTFVYSKPSRILNGHLIIDIRCHLNNSFNFLLPKSDNIEDWILNNSELFFAFLAGYIDAEGHIYTRNPSKGKGTMPFSGIEIGTYDKNILFQIWEKLNQLDIECPKPLLNKLAGYANKNGLINRKDCWRISISKKKSLISVFEKLKPHLKHAKRYRNMVVAYENVLARSFKTPADI